MEVVITRPALEDLHGIFVYVAENFYSEKLAHRVIDDLLEATIPLSDFPHMGLDADKKFGRKFIDGVKLYILVVEKNLIWYIILNNKLNILRFTNQSQDVARLLFKLPE